MLELSSASNTNWKEAVATQVSGIDALTDSKHAEN
jgi:hypothetical protein